MSRKLFFTGSMSALPLALAAVLVLHSTRARSEETKTSPVEVRVDNFTFGPDTLAVAANSTVTWINKDDVPHVIAINDGRFKSKALDTDEKYSYTFSKYGQPFRSANDSAGKACRARCAYPIFRSLSSSPELDLICYHTGTAIRNLPPPPI